MSLTFLKSGDSLKHFRKEQWENQKGICPILKQYVPFEDTVVDHIHGKKGEIAGQGDAHMVRGVIQNGCNAAEGKCLSVYKRMGLTKLISFPDFLRNLADYVEHPPLLGSGIVHPAGSPKRETIGKREFNRVIKYWSQAYPKRKLPLWKDKGRNGKVTGRMNLTKQWKKYIEDTDKIHYGKYS